MTHIARRLLSRLLAALTCVSLVVACATTSAQSYDVRFDRAALDAMLAPIALYPDPLLSQVLMAATYPREVDEAAQWSRARPGLTGDAAVRTSDGWDWDPSVRSLLAFPMVLDTMARNMRWTEDLGVAFLAQPGDVMDAVQDLRRRAYANGALRSTEYARVIDTGREVVIDPYSPHVAYVPYYDPRVVYGSWWWPSRPPVYWARWPGYNDFPGRAYGVHWGPGIGISAGFFFGGIVWPRREVHVVNTNAYYYTRRVVIDRPGEIHRHAPVRIAPARDVGPGAWRHDASRHRGPDLREPQHARDRNERPAPPATRAAEVRRDPVPANAAPQRRAERQDDPPRMTRSVERQPSPPVAGTPQPQRRTDRPAARDEPRATESRNRDDDGPRARGPQQGARGAERADPPARATERGRSGGDAGPGRAPQRTQDPRPG